MPRKTPTSANDGRGAGRVVDEQADDEAADDGTDEQPAEADEVAAPQGVPRAGSHRPFTLVAFL